MTESKEKNYLTRSVRIATMLCLIIAFFVIAPLVILYTMGYRYDVRTGIVRETGVLSIDVLPKDVHVELSGKTIGKRMPIRIPDLAPGTYNISLTKEGFLPWTKDIQIKKIQTTYIKNITLFREQSPSLYVKTPDNIEEMKVSYDGSYLLIRSTDDAGEHSLAVINTQDQTVQSMTIATSTGPISFEWSPFDQHALVYMIEDKQISYFLYNAERDIIGNKKTLPNTYNPRQTQWISQGSQPVIFLRDENKKRMSKLTLSTFEDIGTVTSSQWFVDQDETIYTIDNEKKAIILPDGTKLSPHTRHIDQIHFIKGDIWITTADDQINIFRKERNDLVLLTTLPTQHIRYNPNTKEWITWSPWEIWAIYEDGATALLNRTSEPIANVWPLDEHGVLMIVREHTIKGFNPGYFVSHTLLENTEITHAGANINSRKIFFQGTLGGRSGVFFLKY